MDKNKKKNFNKNGKKINDLTSFISAESLMFDPEGSYTGTTVGNYYYNDDYDLPIQDADDL
ncbi:MAG: hypothetical protein ACI4IG_08885 [Eubacterium sp.]